MPTTMKCPGCQAPLRLRDELAGKTIKCPRCSHVLKVPAAEEVVELVEEEAGPEEITAEPPKPKKASAKQPCPECGEPVSRTATKCPYCKAPLDEDDEEDDEREQRKRSKFKPCPRCGESGARRVVWTIWGSFYGPALFTHVRCPGCGYAYNGRSGRSNLIPAIIFVTVPLVLILAILGGLGWIIYSVMAASKG
jgi:predicted RNA-binding Zn-ribbon protein involved in translation (DUF1610 family)